LIIKQTTTTVLQPVIFVVISILGVASIYSSAMLTQRAIAIPSDPVCTYNTPTDNNKPSVKDKAPKGGGILEAPQLNQGVR
jgi:hypothetical protein